MRVESRENGCYVKITDMGLGSNRWIDTLEQWPHSEGHRWVKACARSQEMKSISLAHVELHGVSLKH